MSLLSLGTKGRTYTEFMNYLTLAVNHCSGFRQYISFICNERSFCAFKSFFYYVTDVLIFQINLVLYLILLPSKKIEVHGSILIK